MAVLPREANYVGQRQSQRFTPGQTRRIARKTGEHGVLSSDQFMPMGAVKRLPAVDMRGGPVSELIPVKQEQIRENEGETEDYPALKEAMRTGGPGGTEVPPMHIASGQRIANTYMRSRNVEPPPEIEDAPKAFGNGGHRIAMAHELGWKAVPYTEDAETSGWGDDRFQKDDEDDDYYGSGSTSNSEDYDANASESSASPVVHGRSHIPGFTGESAYHKGNRWHARGTAAGKPPGEGLYSQLHPALSPGQFGAQSAHPPGTSQPILPGMGNGVGEWNGPTAHEFDEPSPRRPQRSLGASLRSAAAKETHWPGGGRIMTGDR